MMNNWNGIGRLTKDSELRYTPQGKAVANFTMAVNRPFTNQQGEREADFIPVVVWGKLAENVANYTRKGSLVGVTGRIQTRNFDGNDGKKVYITEIVAESVQFLDQKQSNGNGQSQPYNNGGGQPQQQWSGQPQQQFGGGVPGQGSFGGNAYQQNQPMNQPSYSQDPFANSRGPIEVSEDDLPF